MTTQRERDARRANRERSRGTTLHTNYGGSHA
jgi:hypothetical protein